MSHGDILFQLLPLRLLYQILEAAGVSREFQMQSTWSPREAYLYTNGSNSKISRFFSTVHRGELLSGNSAQCQKTDLLYHKSGRI